MGGGRNGRFVKWAPLVALLVTTIYVFYLYQGLKTVLQEREVELNRLEDLQSRLGDQMKDLADTHTSLQEKLNSERVSHQRTRMEKNSLDKQCQDDLKSMKETLEGEKYKVEQERDNYKLDLDEEREAKQRLQEQQDALLTRYDKDMSTCEEEKEEQEAKINSYRTDVAKANTEKQGVEVAKAHCENQVLDLEDIIKTKESQVRSLQHDLTTCQDTVASLTSQKEDLEAEIEEAKKQGGGGPAHETKVVSEEDKNMMMSWLSDKLSRGETLSAQEIKALSLMKEEQKIKMAGNRNFDPPGRDTRGLGQHTDRRQTYASPDNHRGRPSFDPKKYGTLLDKKRPTHNAATRGMESRTHGGMGMKQQLPELAEQEEVKELQLEEQEPGVGGVMERETPEKEDEGMDEQAFDPAEREGGEREEGEEEEGREYDFDHEQEKPAENFNLPVPAAGVRGNGRQEPMPHPRRVVEEGELDEKKSLHSPPKFENPDRAFDKDYPRDEQEELEREQEGEEEQRLDKAYQNNNDIARRQFEEDMRLDREERQRMRGLLKQGPGAVRNDDRRGGPDPGGMEWGQRDMEALVKQGMDESELERREAANKQIERRPAEHRIRDNL